MNILLLGGGGREHALAYALSKSESIDNIYCSPGNPGINRIAQKVHLPYANYPAIVQFCRSKNIELVVVGPEQPLADGIADVLRDSGLSVFGPGKKAALLESSKKFAKEFMYRRNIPTAKFESFSKRERRMAHSFIEKQNPPIVLKADGLAAGKGVVVAYSYDDAHMILDLMFDGLFKTAGENVVIEEFINGEEASILAICDGKDFITLASSQDHKRALDGDEGKNTGGMGAYSPAPVLTNDIRIDVEQSIIRPTIDGIAHEGSHFIGCLYIGLMIKDNKPYVIEYNVRFGDPETQAVLSIFKGDFAKLLKSAAMGKLDTTTCINIQTGASCCIVMSSDGYPGKYEQGFEITGIKEAEQNGALVFHAGTEEKNGKLYNAGGRVLGVTAVADNLSSAVEKAYQFVDMIDFSNKFFRKDIGKKGINRLNNQI